MKLLLDTHVLLWWLDDDKRLQPVVVDAISDRSNRVFVSVVSLWEILVKVRARKLEADIDEIDRAIGPEGFERLAIERSHLTTLAALPVHHRDPFDHILTAQAIAESALFVTDDPMIRRYPVEVFRDSRSGQARS